MDRRCELEKKTQKRKNITIDNHAECKKDPRITLPCMIIRDYSVLCVRYGTPHGVIKYVKCLHIS